jgi:hypothetical protein
MVSSEGCGERGGFDKSIALYTRVQRVKALDVFSKIPRIF